MRKYQKEFSIVKMAKVLSVSRSGFDTSHHQKNHEETDSLILKAFNQHKERYGSPRIHF